MRNIVLRHVCWFNHRDVTANAQSLKKCERYATFVPTLHWHEARGNMERCKACGAAVPNPKERRSLESVTSNSVRNGLVQFSWQVDGNVPRVNEGHFYDGYVCKKCFVLVGKSIDLTNKLMDMEKTIITNLRSALISFGSHGSGRGTKRCLCQSYGTSTPKRMRIETNSGSSSVVVGY